jgi:hypothetical protein
VNIVKLKTLAQLGLANLIRVAWYRTSVRMGVNPVRKIDAGIPKPPFLTLPSEAIDRTSSPQLNTASAPSIKLFGYLSYLLNPDEIPDWFESPISGERIAGSDKSWWQIPDFNDSVGDIKQLWELSRFDWVLRLAQLIRFNAENDPKLSAAYELQLNQWLADWIEKNPPYRGVNWKCGQEASIRVMHLICAARILGSLEKPTGGFVQLIALHLQRIAPTISYAVAQDNNHGTSEATALFVGGEFLSKNNVPSGAKWGMRGRRWLENRAKRLIGTEGSFSQYSVNYHRMMLDTLSFSETVRQWFSLEPFSDIFYDRARAATNWLAGMVDPKSGDVPNIGANDGARLFPLTDTNYRDYRPSLIWAYKVFSDGSPLKSFKNALECTEILTWLGLEQAQNSAVLPTNTHYKDGGFVVLNTGTARLVVNYPLLKFRPSQNDLLHVDLWVNGENLLRDAGSYSYNCEEPWQSYFPSTVAHNTIQFDGRDQMPRISRFLLGAWPKAKDVVFDASDDSEINRFSCGFKDYRGAVHHRAVELHSTKLEVTDIVRGFSNKAVARFRLTPKRKWRVIGFEVSDGQHALKFSASSNIESIRLTEGWESRFYFQKSKIPIIEVVLTEPGRLTMEYQWA